jgi:phosphotriesterase-related protein
VLINTVCGKVSVDELGRTLMHEHLYLAFPGAEFDPSAKFEGKTFVTEAARRLRELRKDWRVKTFVDPCPIELGRDPRMMKEVSERSEVNIVCTTGFYYERMGIPIYWRSRSVEEIAELYIREITVGIDETGIKAGAIKVATGAPVVSKLEEHVLKAACLAQRETGVPIITHTQDGCCGPEQQTLFSRGGVAAHRCLIGHCCGNPDPKYHRRIVDGGSYIGFDRIGISRLQSDEVRADNLIKLVGSGHRNQIMMSQDGHCGWRGKYYWIVSPEEQMEIETLRAQGKWPLPYTYMFTNFIPMLLGRGMGQADIDSILEENPRRFFAGEPLGAKPAFGN